jgi:hypothetical protein
MSSVIDSAALLDFVRTHARVAALPDNTELPHNVRLFVEYACRVASRKHGWDLQEEDIAQGAALLYRALYCKSRAAAPMSLSIPPRLDAVWHELILNTEDYAAVCATLGRTVNHTTRSAADAAKDKNMRIQRLKAAYEKVYGAVKSYDDLWWRGEKEVEAEVAPQTKKRARAEEDIDVPFEVALKSTSGKTHTVVVRPSTTVWELKCFWQDKEGTLPDQQDLIFAGRRLDEKLTLGAYNIKELCAIHVVSRLRGC